MTLYIDTRPTLGEWIEKPNDITYHRRYCDTVFGRYTIAILGDKYELLLHGFVTYSFDPYDTFDQAKAAAQADYEARTAERFRAIELPTEWSIHTGDHVAFVSGYNQAIRDIHEAIAKAKEQP